MPNESDRIGRIDPEDFDPETDRDETAVDVADWEQVQFQTLQKYLYPENQTEEQAEKRTDILVYSGKISPEDHAAKHNLEMEEVPETVKSAPFLHHWFMRRTDIVTLELSQSKGGDPFATIPNDGERGEVYPVDFVSRPGAPTYAWLINAAHFVERVQAGRLADNTEKRRKELVQLLRGTAVRGPSFTIGLKDGTELDPIPAICRRFLRSANELEDGAKQVDLSIDVDALAAPDDAPAPRPETPDHDPDPFTGPNGTAGLLAGRFQNGVKDSLLDATGEPAPTTQGEWGLGPDDAPVRVEKLDGGNSPYEGRAVLKVQAHSDADPAEVEAAMGWEMLERMDMDTVWLHLLLLGHASAPHRRGERQVMTIPRKRVENVLGFHRGDGKSVEQRAEEVEQHIKALQSIYVRFQGVKRHGDRTRLTNERNATPLWNIQMLEHADLFENSVRRDWVLKVKEGLWGEEFLHEWEDPQWTPLPKEWFDQIDRRGKDWTQRLAVYLLFHFRRNVENGAVVNLNAGTMLDICGADTGGRSQRKTERKKRLSSALDALRDRYGIGVQAERVHMRHTKGMSTENWKTNSATFYPPEKMSGELFRNESDGRPPLPEVKGGDWTKDQIKRLRSDLGWSQAEMAEYLGVSQGYVSQLESGRATPPSDEKCKLFDRLDSRHR